MIIIVDLCHEKNSLSSYEFVHPIAETVNDCGFRYEILHYKELIKDGQDTDWLENFFGLILCGTALKDNAYTEHPACFHWLRDWKKPALGICAGMQVLGSEFGGRIVPQPAIGLEKIAIIAESPLLGGQREIEAYHLHNYGATLPDHFRLLAGSPTCVEAFCHEELPIYGIIFHPEVRNRWILDKFLRLGQD
jgi:GMP synthase-like glutamine amidotransferase